MSSPVSPPPIRIRAALTPALDTPLLQMFPVPSLPLQVLFRAQYMVAMWQPWMFSASALRTMSFLNEDIVWFETIAKRMSVPLDMVIGVNPLLEIPGINAPFAASFRNQELLTLATWQLITMRHHIAGKEIDQLLATTPYRRGMTAAQLFVSTVP